MANRFWTILLVFTVLAMGGTVRAQSEAESATDAIVLQSVESNRTEEVAVGTKVSVRYTVDARTFPDLTLEEVLDSSVVLSGDTVGLSYLERITVRDDRQYRSGRKILIASAIITVVDFLAFFISISFLLTGSVFFVGLLILASILAIPAIVAMPAGFIVGIVLMLNADRTYLIGKRWKASLRKK